MNFLGILAKNQLTISMKFYFLTLNSLPLICVSVPMSSLHCFDYCGFVLSFEIGKCESFNFVLFQEYFLAMLDCLHFHMTFRSDLSISAKKESQRELHEITEINLGSIAILVIRCY